jgi:hypothetical protein
MDKSRHRCSLDEVCTCAPTDKELHLLGFEPWQISIMRKLPVDVQWEAHDEFIRRLMSNDDVDHLKF